MAEHDFDDLYSHYPAVIAQMPDTFTSHQFILELARQNQTEYIEALYSYRHHVHRGVPAPFMMVHGVLALHLLKYPDLIEQIAHVVPSTDIFGNPNECAEWRKIR